MAVDLLAHPAVVAWRRLWPELVPDTVVELRARRTSAIYLLTGVGTDGSAVIAKRSPAPEAMIERTVYERSFAACP